MVTVAVVASRKSREVEVQVAVMIAVVLALK